MLPLGSESFDRLIGEVQRCELCPTMQGCTRVLSWANGQAGAPVMFVGEAPGRLGADRTAVPFHGDKAGDNFELLLRLARLSRREVFVTNAVLCNPRDDAGNNAPPSKSVLKNCSENLAKQIRAVEPQIVVTLGSAALESTRLIEPHSLTLATSVRTLNRWFDRCIIPLYHPGARAMIHRNFALQTADYYFVGEQVRRLQRPTSKPTSKAKPKSSSWDVVLYALAVLEECSLFRLHKTMYLIDFESLKQTGSAITDFFYIRQKEGPYCVELGSRWFKSHEENVRVMFRDRKPWLAWNGGGLFSEAPELDTPEVSIVDEVLGKVKGLSDGELKTKAYLTAPMKRSLRDERLGLTQLNRPLF
jgi:uracil-DNA glycosylase family 4